jgi:hypothetical protein
MGNFTQASRPYRALGSCSPLLLPLLILSCRPTAQEFGGADTRVFLFSADWLPARDETGLTDGHSSRLDAKGERDCVLEKGTASAHSTRCERRACSLQWSRGWASGLSCYLLSGETSANFCMVLRLALRLASTLTAAGQHRIYRLGELYPFPPIYHRVSRDGLLGHGRVRRDGALPCSVSPAEHKSGL